MKICAIKIYQVELTSKEFEVLAAILNYLDQVNIGALYDCEDREIVTGWLDVLATDPEGETLRQLAVDFANPPMGDS